MHKRNIGNALNTSVNVNKDIILNVKSEQGSKQAASSVNKAQSK